MNVPNQEVIPSHSDFRVIKKTLFGIYSKECLPLRQKLIEQGKIKLQDMITHFELLRIYVDNIKLFNDSLFLNINDMDDFQNALKQL